MNFGTHWPRPESALDYDAACEELQSALRAVPQPVIAMIQGHAVGSGCIVAASCDFRIAVRRAKFGIPVAKFGFIAPLPDTLRLVQLIGPGQGEMDADDRRAHRSARRRRRSASSTRWWSPSNCATAVEELAATLAANAPLTLKATKQMIEHATGPSSDVRKGAAWYQEIFRSRDFQEGLDAFFAKRKPEFRGE